MDCAPREAHASLLMIPGMCSLRISRPRILKYITPLVIWPFKRSRCTQCTRYTYIKRREREREIYKCKSCVRKNATPMAIFQFAEWSPLSTRARVYKYIFVSTLMLKGNYFIVTRKTALFGIKHVCRPDTLYTFFKSGSVSSGTLLRAPFDLTARGSLLFPPSSAT